MKNQSVILSKPIAGHSLERDTILFCPGAAMHQDKNMLHNVIHAIRQTGKQCLLVGISPNSLPCQDGVLIRKNVDLESCLNACCAAIHHGGIGTVSLCFYCGVPQLILPRAFDQFDNAWRVEQLGCGIELKNRSKRTINKALTRLLNEDALHKRCQWAREKYGEKNHCMENIRHTLERAYQNHQRAKLKRGTAT